MAITDFFSSFFFRFRGGPGILGPRLEDSLFGVSHSFGSADSDCELAARHTGFPRLRSVRPGYKSNVTGLNVTVPNVTAQCDSSSMKLGKYAELEVT